MGGGIGMGNTCKPMAVLFQCMTKFTTKKKKKSYHFAFHMQNAHSQTSVKNQFFPPTLSRTCAKYNQVNYYKNE